MQSIWFVLLFLHSAFSFRYQNEVEQLFRAFEENDSERMEDIWKFLENIDPNELQESESNATENFNHVPDLIIEEGYPVEDHEIVTNDGYILHMFRIPYGKKSPTTNKTRPPILFMHGLMDSSNGFVVLGAGKSLAYLLADAGYDVWLANARGTTPSRTHIRLNPNGLRQKKYWSFSWHHIGTHDLPVLIDHILNETNHKKLNYIGFSQGTTSFLVLSSMRPEYNDKLLDVHLMAPVSSLKNIRNIFFNTAARFYHPLKRLFEILHIYKITYGDRLVMKLFEIACESSKAKTGYSCDHVTDIISGSNYKNRAYSPGGASTRQIIHYGQMIRNYDFSLFDYDSKLMNRLKYGQNSPPKYNLTEITAPVNLYYSKGDDTATMENAIKLQSLLPNLRSTYLVPAEDFSHTDFAFSELAKEVLYDQMIENINRINEMN